jgi:hypothetical protein
MTFNMPSPAPPAASVTGKLPVNAAGSALAASVIVSLSPDELVSATVTGATALASVTETAAVSEHE